MTDKSFEVRPVTRALGGVVSGLDLARPLEASVIEDLRQAWLEYQVLFFRDQDLSPEQFETFVRHFGDIDNHHFIEKIEGSTTVEHLYPKQNDNPYVPPTSRYHIDVSMFRPRARRYMPSKSTTPVATRSGSARMPLTRACRIA
jgi:alpha-ketoglutarate-dependent taurine dioxygenase